MSFKSFLSCLICMCCMGCATTGALVREVKGTRPVKFYYEAGMSDIENLRHALFYIWRLENYVNLLEGAIW